MSLVIENGSIVAGADSFATAAELVTYAANFGRTIPAGTPEQEALLRRAYLQMDALPWKGYAVSPDQTGSWPRYGVCRNGFDVDSTSIPAQIKAGQMALATEIHADDLNDPETKQGAIIREKVGPIDTEFAAASKTASKPAAVKQSAAQFAGFVEPAAQIKLSRS